MIQSQPSLGRTPVVSHLGRERERDAGTSSSTFLSKSACVILNLTHTCIHIKLNLVLWF
ncbi:hypothetical protein QTP86_020648 [Hemibagrus guttatus]|nr:hypothetical protein QTP86_020648 [Hemibagrus guttatus]